MNAKSIEDFKRINDPLGQPVVAGPVHSPGQQ